MSYLSPTRIHFSGRFQADTSTVNNDVRHFDNKNFVSDFQEIMTYKKNDAGEEEITKFNGYWNPEGTGAWRLLDCKVTSAVVNDQICITEKEDPIVGYVIGGSNNQVSAKIVDLDPQQQLVSQLWGLTVNLENSAGTPLFSGQFEVAPFCDLWLRQQNADEFLDQQLAAAYQSVLTGVQWSETIDSPCLKALKSCSAEGLLSIRFNVFGFDRTPYANDYAMGLVVGTIGVAHEDEPKHFVMGRQLTPCFPQGPSFPFVPENQVGNIQAVVVNNASDKATVIADFGNALPIVDSSGTLEDLGDLKFGILKDVSIDQGDAVAEDRIEILGDIPYKDKDWFTTAGICSFNLNANVKKLIEDHPLALVRWYDNGCSYKVLNRETADGVYVRADMFVFRLNPGEQAMIDFYASQYGHPFSGEIVLEATEGFMGGAGTGADLPGIEIPKVGEPKKIISYFPEIKTNTKGYAALTILAAVAGPGNPRKYIDGQLYGIGYHLKSQPKNYNSNPFNFVSVLAWDKFEVPEEPLWYEHVQPIFRQYGNLYPIMSKRLVNLSDYDSVVSNLAIMKLSFSLSVTDPNYMPVTRDLSEAKRQMIVKWLNAKGPNGSLLPPLGTMPTEVSDTKTVITNTEEAGKYVGTSSKVGFLRQAFKANEEI